MQTVWYIRRTQPYGPGRDIFEMANTLYVALKLLSHGSMAGQWAKITKLFPHLSEHGRLQVTVECTVAKKHVKDHVISEWLITEFEVRT